MHEDASRFIERLAAYVHTLETWIQNIPESAVTSAAKKKLLDEIRNLREMLLEQRAPRFVVLGRRGAGKSSLINAIFGERVAGTGSVKAETIHPTWYDYTGSRGTLRLLDTRGVQEGTGTGDVKDDPAFQSIAKAIGEQQPDAILFLCKAKEVDAALGADIRFLTAIYHHCRRTWDYPPPVLALVTQVDELDPPDIRDPREFGDVEKSANISHAVDVLRQHLGTDGPPAHALVRSLPVNAYMGFRPDGTVRADYRWNIDVLIEILSSHLHQSAQAQFARVSQVRSVQRRIAERAVGAFATVAAAVGAAPLPGSDILPLVALQSSMVLAIAYIAGRDISPAAVAEFMAAMGINVGAGFAFREAARQLLKLVPGVGLVGAAGVAWVGTNALGKAAIRYYLDEVTLEEARAGYEQDKSSDSGSDGSSAE